MTDVIEYDGSGPFENIEGLVQLTVSVNRDPRAYRNLLGPKGEIGRSRGGPRHDEHEPGIAKVNDMLAAIRSQNVSCRRGPLS